MPDEPAKPALPPDHGQFGVDNATEDDKTLPGPPHAPAGPADQGPKQTNAGDRS